MHSALLTDRIDVISVTHDEWGKEITSIEQNIKAFVSEKNKLILNQQGEEVTSEMRVIVPLNTSVRQESKVCIKKLHGRIYYMPNKQWQIIQLSHGHSLSTEFIEIWL